MLCCVVLCVVPCCCLLIRNTSHQIGIATLFFLSFRSYPFQTSTQDPRAEDNHKPLPQATTTRTHPVTMPPSRLLKELRQNADPTKLPESIISLRPTGVGDDDDCDETSDTLNKWTAIISPPLSSGSLYASHKFQIDIEIPQSYPLEPPRMKFVTDKSKCVDEMVRTYIPHCNVDMRTGEICLDILKNETWSPAWTLQTAVLAVVMLLDNQEPDSPLNVDMANLYRLDDQIAIKSIVDYYMTK